MPTVAAVTPLLRPLRSAGLTKEPERVDETANKPSKIAVGVLYTFTPINDATDPKLN